MKLSHVIACAAGVALVGCSSMKIQTDFDPAVSFEPMKTYAWMADPQQVATDPAVNNPLVSQRIKRQTDSVMAAKGYELVASNPDFLLASYHGGQDKIQVNSSPSYWGYGYGASWGGVQVTEYTEGTLIIDVVSTEKKELMWRGTATASIYTTNPNPDEITAKVHEAVTKILARFPPEEN